MQPYSWGFEASNYRAKYSMELDRKSAPFSARVSDDLRGPTSCSRAHRKRPDQKSDRGSVECIVEA